jgi:hypothetical protein
MKFEMSLARQAVQRSPRRTGAGALLAATQAHHVLFETGIN